MTTPSPRGFLSMFVAALFLVVLTVAVPGCKQGLGDPCQVSSDCEDGDVCILPVGGTPQVGGVCAANSGPDLGADLSVSFDLSGDLSSTDGGAVVDLAQPAPDLYTPDL